MSFIGADPAIVRSIEKRWLDADYSHWKQEIAYSHPGALLTSEGEASQDGNPGRKAVYSISSSESELFVFVVDQTWFLSYRETYPAACSAQAHAALKSFFSKWPGRIG